MAGDGNGSPSVEELQAKLTEAMAQVAQLTNQVRGLAAERDTYRSQTRGANDGAASATGHVLGRVLGVDADFAPVDQHYMTRAEHTRQLQEAVSQAYQMARGDMFVLREIDRATAAYPELRTWDSPLSKKTFEILSKERYAAPRRDPASNLPVNPASWEDLVYESVNALPRAARMAKAELVLAEQAAAAASSAAAEAQGAAGMASGGAPAQAGATIQDEAWMKAAEAGDTAAMREMLKQHASAVTGSPA